MPNIKEGTEKKLLLTALDLFAQNGFEGTSTREICKKAGVNISLIPYYFGSKEGLYHASLKMIAEFVFSLMKPSIEKINNAKNNSREENMELLHELIQNFAGFAFTQEIPKTALLLVIREQLEPSPAFEIIYNTSMKHVYGAFRKLMAALLNKDEKDPELIYRTTSMAGQLMVFRLAKQLTLRSLGRDEYTENDIEQIKKIVMSQVDTIINSIGG